MEELPGKRYKPYVPPLDLSGVRWPQFSSRSGGSTSRSSMSSRSSGRTTSRSSGRMPMSITARGTRRGAHRGGHASVRSGPPARNFDKCTFDAAQSVAIANCYSSGGPVATTPFAPVAATSAWCLNQIPLGNSSVQREGRRCALSAVAIRATIQAGITTAYANCVTLLVWDRDPNQSSALPAYNSLLNTQNSTSLTNKDYAPRFKILRRWNHYVVGNVAQVTTTNQSAYYIDAFVPLKNKETIWTAADTTGLYPDMQKGALLLYCLSDIAPGTAAPSLLISTRVYFTDA